MPYLKLTDEEQLATIGCYAFKYGTANKIRHLAW